MWSYWKRRLPLNPLGRGCTMSFHWFLTPTQAASLGYVSHGWGRHCVTPGPTQLLEASEPNWEWREATRHRHRLFLPQTLDQDFPLKLNTKPFLLFFLSFSLALGWKDNAITHLSLLLLRTFQIAGFVIRNSNLSINSPSSTGVVYAPTGFIFVCDLPFKKLLSCQSSVTDPTLVLKQ